MAGKREAKTATARESSLPEHTAAIISCDRSAPVLATRHKDKKNGVDVSPPVNIRYQNSVVGYLGNGYGISSVSSVLPNVP
jgi:hypothetical protein